MKQAVLLSKLTETRTTRDKATKAEMDEVRSLLSDPEDGSRISIPACLSASDDDYDYEVVAVMAYVMLKREAPEYTLEQARDDSGLHTVRILLPELLYFYDQVSVKKTVTEKWDKIFKRIDSGLRCPVPKCGANILDSWQFCVECGIPLQGAKESDEGNPTS